MSRLYDEGKALNDLGVSISDKVVKFIEDLIREHNPDPHDLARVVVINAHYVTAMSNLTKD